ncbi:hypothetical protein JIG36_04360 [Actinoplanes sp. LDG1-06]|uniref:Tetratricopeptide repeat protein n=1 Tax=Paractinoplanes ovalisporus TaxID=2810368 RepID=A0ABS2A4L7_9ACTN|nr:hypothetical protein [Actinoplanes ovalisporus]MBM2614788.1 hypothetical protein [Actinoplanes ovalisporus]
MPATEPVIARRYTRSDPRGSYPRITGAPEPAVNRVALFWRPIVDLTPSPHAGLRMRMLHPVARWLAEPKDGRIVWFSRIGVPGLRRQVLRHAGLDPYDCSGPPGLAEDLRTPDWRNLVAVLERFGELDDHLRALVVFHLAQLSFTEYALRLTGDVEPTGEAGRDHYAYQVARAHSRVPGHTDRAVRVFERIASTTPDPRLAVLAAAQGVSHAVRGKGETALAHRFEGLGLAVEMAADSWHGHLARSRFHRALALLRMVERDLGGMRRELRTAWWCNDQLFAAPADEVSTMVAVENRRILLESEIKAASRAASDVPPGTVREWCGELERMDPDCVETRLVLGDGYAAANDLPRAARWYAAAGELGTSDGAVGWFRAGQAFDRLGERERAVQAMGRCLELDTTAVEPRRYLKEAASDGD